MRPFCQLYTGNQQCYSIRYCPFDSHLLACISCDNFGISGAAALYILKLDEHPIFSSKFTINDSFKFNTSLFDVDWSPIDPNLLVTGNGDGSVGVWRWPFPRNDPNMLPYIKSKEHNKEVYSVQWNPSHDQTNHFLSASWDSTIRLWNLNNAKLTSTNLLNGHQSMVYAASFNYINTNTILSVSADKTFRIWDIKSSTPCAYTSQIMNSDILSCDWSKHDANIFVLGYASGAIELRDLRNLKGPAVKSFETAHSYAIKRIKFSPHFPYLFASVSYDMLTRIWTPNEGLIGESKNHTEFAYGVDFDPKNNNRIVDCGWDRKVVLSEFQLPKA